MGQTPKVKKNADFNGTNIKHVQLFGTNLFFNTQQTDQ